MAANQVTVTTPGPTGPAGINWKSSWVTSTNYVYRDVVRYSVNGTIYFCDVAHTSGTIVPTNTAYWSIFVPSGDAKDWATTAKHTQVTDSIGNQGYSSLHQAQKAQDWASLTTDAVTNDANSADVDYSSKAWAVGGTEVTSTAARGSSKDWAIGAGGVSSAQPDGSEFSAKEHASGTTVTTGSAKSWATQDTTAVASSLFSAKEYASGTSATGGTSKQWATKNDGAVASSEYSAKAYANSTDANEPTTGSSKNWATKSGSAEVATSAGYSAKAYAQDETTGTDTTGGSSKGWSQTAKDTQVPGAGTSDRSAKHYSEVASDHATTTSSNSARFLTAASSDPTTRDPNGSGSALQEGDMYFNTSQNKMKVRNASSAWQDTSSSIAGVASVTEYTGSQATNSKWFALTHDVGLQIVWLNGVRQVQGSDYYCVNSSSSTTNITSGTATHIYFVSNVASSDVISLMAFGQVNSTSVVPVSGGTFTGAVTFEGQNTHNTGSNTFTMPTTRGTNNYVLTRDDTAGTGGTTWKETALSPTISSVTYPNGEDGNPKTALDSGSGSGTEDITIVGLNFSQTITSVKITVSGSESNLGASFTRNTAESISVTDVTLRSAGTYTITVTNSTGLTGQGSIIFSGTPGFDLTGQTNGDLGTVYEGTTLNKTITSTTGGDGTITFTHGSPNTPDWMTATGGVSGSLATGSTRTFSLVGHASGGAGTMALAGTTANSGTSTTHTFGIIVKDSQNQGAEQDFSLTVVDYPSGGDTGGSGSPTSGAYSRYTDGSVTYQVHRFTTTGASTLTLYGAVTADILVVAGGGSGGGTGSRAAGGAGGLRWFTGQSLVAGDYTCTVGAGGGNPPDSDTEGNDGSPSSFVKSGTISISASGGGAGGGGGSGVQQNGNDGGSGGGSNYQGSGGTGNDGGYTPVEGYNGGDGSSSPNYGGGGGGGAGDHGSDGSTSSGGAGGVGESNFQNQSSTAFTPAKTTAFLASAGAGEEVSSVRYIAGGGGGGIHLNNSAGAAGGHGGGGDGGGNVVGTNGTTNTGGGGGGGGGDSSKVKGGQGGSGIIIVRYAV